MSAYNENHSVNSLDFKQSARVATTENITLSGLQTVDQVSLAVGDRVLVKDQTLGSQNGIYIVASGAWYRSSDADRNPEISSGMILLVEEGSLNADTMWLLSSDGPISLGTTSLSFTKFTGAQGPSASEETHPFLLGGM